MAMLPLQGNGLNCIDNLLDTIMRNISNADSLEIANYAIKAFGLSLSVLECTGSKLDFNHIAITYSKIDSSLDALKRIWQLYHQQGPLSQEDKVNLVSQIAFLTTQTIDYAIKTKKINCSSAARGYIELATNVLFVARIAADKEKSKLDLTNAFITFSSTQGNFMKIY